jgi:cobalamin biosynthesis protein CobT
VGKLKDIKLDKAEGIARFEQEFRTNQVGMGATKANLIRLLKSVDLVGWSSHEESGRLDRKAFSRFACGSANIFSKRTHVEAESSAVSILVDCSGSMGLGNRMQVTESVVIQLVKILDKADVSYRVFGFDSPDGTYARKVATDGDKEVSMEIEEVTFYPFKHWNESLQRALPKLGQIHKFHLRENPDYSAVMLSLEDLKTRPEKRKVMFFLTDSLSPDVNHMRHLDTVAEKLGIKLIAIGIQSDKVLECHKHSVAVQNLAEMGSASFNKLLKELQ